MRRVVLLLGLGWFLAACSSDSGSETETPLKLEIQPGLALGANHSCVLLASGNAYCWGSNADGQLGLPGVESIGEAEVADASARVDVGEPVAQLVAGVAHTCALLKTGAVKCWGKGEFGVLGGGTTAASAQPPRDLPSVPLGGLAIQLVAGWNHNCALLSSGDVRCWGRGDVGQLGNGAALDVGDDEPASRSALVSLGDTARQLSAGGDASCAVLDSGALHCWGRAVAVGASEDVGDDEAVSEVPALATGIVPTGAAQSQAHSCAWSASQVSCWGENETGQLGLGDIQAHAVGSGVSNLSNVQSLALARRATCVLIGGSVRCTGGSGGDGMSGLGDGATMGDDEPLEMIPAIELGGSAVAVGAGTFHACALLQDSSVRCWGQGQGGKLGIGSAETIGDDETPISAAALAFE